MSLETGFGKGAWGGLFSSARVRILAAYVILLAVSMVASLFFIERILTTRLHEEINADIHGEYREFRRLARGIDPETGEPFGDDIRSIFDVYFSRNIPQEGEAFLAFVEGEPYDSSYAAQVQYDLHEFEPAVRRWTSLTRPDFGQIETPGGTARYLAAPVTVDDEMRGTFVIANLPAAELQEIQDALRVAGQVIGVVYILASALAWLVAGRVLAPLRLLTNAARSITDSDLTRRIPVRGTDEVSRMAATFNDMLDRLKEAFATQREFVNDAGHELRTPITVIRGHLELLEDDPQERRNTLALVMDELDRMNRIVNDLLVLAKAQQPDFLALERVDVAALTRELHDKATTLANRNWRLEATGQGEIVSDRQRLTQAVMQLAQNAAEHTEEQDEIRLGSAVANGEARFWVADSGEGIAPADHERIFERFARGEGRGRTSEGAGLGLSIVKAIAEGHRGRVELQSEPGRGATFTLVIPAQQPAGNGGTR